MILDQTDPTGVGLFSRAARSQAAKLKPNHPSTPSRNLSVQNPTPTIKRPTRNSSAFSKQESRDQREKKYKMEPTPSVGQYNPVRKTRPKMVWDILKVFTNPNRPLELSRTAKQAQKTPKGVPGSQTVIESAQSTPTHMEEALIDHSVVSEASRSRCMVNMSRTTGRKQRHTEAVDWGDADVMHSLGYLRGSVAKNIYLGKTGEQRERKENMGGSYSYDYNLVKPKRSCNMDFSRCLGRDQKPTDKDDSHNYVHYDYDNYVWSGKSGVFPNTKTHVISFEKQKSRYSRSDLQ